MFTNAGYEARPVGWDRRGFLKELGLGGIALASLIADQTASGAAAVPAGDLSEPLAPRQPHFAPRARNVIFLFMVGGASQLETFDHKPLLKKYAGKLARDIFSKEDLEGLNPEKTYTNTRIVPPVFSFKRYGQSGAWVSEIFPNLTKVVDDIAFINSMHTESAIHGPGQILMHTGYSRQGHPSLGSWVTYGLGTENRNMPGFVAMTDGRPSGGRALHDAGFLPGIHQATLADAKPGNPPVPHIQAPAFLSRDRQREQLDLVRKLNRLHRGRHRTQPELDARIASFETAFRMQMEAPELFDIRNEPDSVKALYGDTDFGRKCLTARRLVESGVRFVEILDGAPRRLWDAHGNRGGLIKNHRTNAARTDRGITALIMDLKSRGLLDETLVVWATEFGRTPMEESDMTLTKTTLGRGHHHYGFSMWMAGGGVKPGITHGATDELGMHAIKDRVSHHDLHATILHLLGLDHKRLTFRHNSRDFRLTDVYGNVVHELIA